MTEASPSDSELVSRARNGDARAFGQLVERHQDYVYNGVYHMVGSEQEAEDLAQEVFLKACRGLESFEGRSRFTTWLYGIVLNTVRNFWRRRDRADVFSVEATAEGDGRGLQLAAESDSPVRSAERGEQVRMVRRAIAELDDNMREIIVLRDIQGLSYEDLEKVLEIPAGTVKSRLYRARQQLKEIMTPYWAAEK